jgi:hypothetical protein
MNEEVVVADANDLLLYTSMLLQMNEQLLFYSCTIIDFKTTAVEEATTVN